MQSKALVVGDGISGKGAEILLRNNGYLVDIMCSSDAEKIVDFSYDLVVISPSISLAAQVCQIARCSCIELIGEIELASRYCDKPIIAITGTNGKTTCTQLIGSMIGQAYGNCSVCGNVGISFAEEVAKGNYDFFCVEVSSFQLESCTNFHPHIALVTNISSDHLDRHGDMEEYARCKLKIAAAQTQSDYLVLSYDDIEAGYLSRQQFCSNVLWSSLNYIVSGAYIIDDKIYYFDEFICKTSDIKMMGVHNVSNALNAVVIAKILNIENSVICDVLSKFNVDKNRLEFVATVDARSYYNDSKGTNIGATKKAIASFAEDTALILGGSDKGYEFDELFVNIPQYIKFVFAIGEVSDKIVRAGVRNAYYNIVKCNNLKEAVKRSSLLPIVNVLLSPATASFDQFADYKDRGNKFVQYVGDLKNEQIYK